MSKAEFIPEAEEELLAAVDYYAAAQAGLGERFIQAVEQATALALMFPDIGSLYHADTRRVVVKNFPFTVIYRPSPVGIIIFAVAHQSRQPGYWREQLDT